MRDRNPRINVKREQCAGPAPCAQKKRRRGGNLEATTDNGRAGYERPAEGERVTKWLRRLPLRFD